MKIAQVFINKLYYKAQIPESIELYELSPKLCQKYLYYNDDIPDIFYETFLIELLTYLKRYKLNDYTLELTKKMINLILNKDTSKRELIDYSIFIADFFL